MLSDIYDAWRQQNVDWLASYLPDDFCHVIHIPPEIHPLGGACVGKRSVLFRLGAIASQFDFLTFDSSRLLIEGNRAALEIPIKYRHQQTGETLETTLVNFWRFEDGWPVHLAEYHDIGRIQDFVSRVAAKEPAQV